VFSAVIHLESGQKFKDWFVLKDGTMRSLVVIAFHTTKGLDYLRDKLLYKGRWTTPYMLTLIAMDVDKNGLDFAREFPSAVDADGNLLNDPVFVSLGRFEVYDPTKVRTLSDLSVKDGWGAGFGVIGNQYPDLRAPSRARMTVPQAKKYCDKMVDCFGFTFDHEGAKEGKPVSNTKKFSIQSFKPKSHISSDLNSWYTVLKGMCVSTSGLGYRAH
jgi:hypothetical protein